MRCSKGGFAANSDSTVHTQDVVYTSSVQTTQHARRSISRGVRISPQSEYARFIPVRLPRRSTNLPTIRVHFAKMDGKCHRSMRSTPLNVFGVYSFLSAKDVHRRIGFKKEVKGVYSFPYNQYTPLLCARREPIFKGYTPQSKLFALEVYLAHSLEYTKIG